MCRIQSVFVEEETAYKLWHNFSQVSGKKSARVLPRHSLADTLKSYPSSPLKSMFACVDYEATTYMTST